MILIKINNLKWSTTDIMDLIFSFSSQTALIRIPVRLMTDFNDPKRLIYSIHKNYEYEVQDIGIWRLFTFNLYHIVISSRINLLLFTYHHMPKNDEMPIPRITNLLDVIDEIYWKRCHDTLTVPLVWINNILKWII